MQAGSLFQNGLKGIVYDCDGVMINSREANSLFYNRVLAYFGLPPMTEAQEQYTYMATGMESLLFIVPPHLHGEIHAVVTEKVFYRDVIPALTLVAGFREFVCRMRERGVRQAMCTNRTTEGFEEVMRFFSFPRVFDPIMTVSCAKPKPSPDGVRRICAQWAPYGIGPDQMLFIGDSSYDKEAAEQASVPFAAFNAFEEADCGGVVRANSYDELEAQLAGFCGPDQRLS